jgi:hypothetical protein
MRTHRRYALFRRVVFALGAIAVLGAAGFLLAKRVAASGYPASGAAQAPALRVPRFPADPTFDGELVEAPWRASARTGTFLAPGGTPARPYSDARFGWRDGELYVGLYAADEEIASRDSFHLTFTTKGGVRTMDVSPLGVVSSDGWAQGARVGHDLDGTLDAPNDDDEEWVIEMALPLAPLGLRGAPSEEIRVAIERCDTFHSGARGCGAWIGVLVLE